MSNTVAPKNADRQTDRQTDRQIDRQSLLSCLDEIDECFDSIETVLLTLTSADQPNPDQPNPDQLNLKQLNLKQLNGALRAAHTAKGLGAMFGFDHLGSLSHRLEDYLKILKIRESANDESAQIDDELQTWLLQILDRLRQISTRYRQNQAIEETWLASEITPLLGKVHSRLGDLTERDEAALLNQRSESDVVAVLFETEVEGLLQRLEGVLADPERPCLREELDIIAQELMDLGQTLELDAFAELCCSIHLHLAGAEPEGVEAIARHAVKDWRQTQALVLIGKTENLPRHFRLEAEPEIYRNLEQEQDNKTTASLELSLKDSLDALPTEIMRADGENPLSDASAAESTVKVPLHLLIQLNDLFGELTIQRNTLTSRLKKLDGIVDRVSTPVQKFKGLFDALDLSSVDSTALDPAVFDLNNQNSELSLIAQEQTETAFQLKEATEDIKLRLRDIKQASSDIARTTKELQINVTRATMRPFSDVVKPFPRQVRDLSARYGKQVDFQVHGSHTLVDRHVLDTLSNSLMHLLRNAFDHGIESPEQRIAAGKSPQGRIDIWATHRGNQTLVFVQDDGAGIDIEGVRNTALQMGADPAALAQASAEDLVGLIFEPGFSTAGEVSALSGRGIGMDVVRTDLTRVRGTVKVDTQLGEGTTFTISVPFTLSTLRSLMVEVGGIRLAFATDSIQEVVRLKSHTVHAAPGQDILAWEGIAVPLIRLDQWLGFNCPVNVSYEDDQPIVNEPIALLVHHESGLKGLYVDKFWGEREIIVRQVEDVMPLPTGFIGCTILEDGHAVPLADTLKLIEWVIEQTTPVRKLSNERFNQFGAESDSAPLLGASNAAGNQLSRSLTSSFAGSPNQSVAQARPSSPPTVLVVDDSVNFRRLLVHTLEQEGYRVVQSRDGQDAVDKLLDGLSAQAVLCDVEMPRLDGYGFLAEIKTKPQFSNLPVVMISSRSSEKHRQLAKQLGAADYITKPYQDYQLLKVLNQLLISPVSV